MLADLLAHPEVEEVCHLHSSFGFMAFHGGGLEEATDFIAQQAAAATGSSYYGIHQPASLKWHVPSHRIDPQHSAPLAKFLDHVDTVITIHGFGRQGFFTSLLLGGRNRILARHVAQHLRESLPAYNIIDDLTNIPADLAGQHVNNPVNRVRHHGVQIELPPRVRGASPLWWDWEGPHPTPHTQSLINGLVRAVNTWDSNKSFMEQDAQ